LKRKNCEFLILPFFKEKQNTFFQLSTTYKIYLLNCISWGRWSKYIFKKAEFKFEFASKISGIFGRKDPEKPGLSREFGNGK